MQMRNLLNHNDSGLIIGNIASPLFGKTNQAAGSATQSGTNFSEIGGSSSRCASLLEHTSLRMKTGL
jgi:hypothetical protein